MDDHGIVRPSRDEVFNFAEKTQDLVCGKSQACQITTRVLHSWEVPFLENVTPNTEDKVRYHSWQDSQCTMKFTNTFYEKDESVQGEIGELIITFYNRVS